MPCKPKHYLLSLVSIVLILSLVLWSPPPAAAMSSGDTLVLTVVPAAVILGTATAGYLLYKNRFSQPADAKGRLGYNGPGEFFIGGFAGGAFVTDTAWTYHARGRTSTANTMKLDPGATGGIKLGYFLDSLPYFGVEAEGSIGNHRQSGQTVSLNPPLPGVANAQVPAQTLLAWTMALHLVGRYGYLPDPEVPFGRLQPYVGIGPGLVVLYAEADSTKNFSLEVEAGLRYMFTKHLGGFLEYKFSKQWQIELESQPLNFNNTGLTASKAVFDFDRHQIVLGLAYHF
jgi:opacity protein-like surface antigen